MDQLSYGRSLFETQSVKISGGTQTWTQDL